MDFDPTLTNPAISGYFDGSIDTPPVVELEYVITHPFLKQSFLTELVEILESAQEEMANIAGTKRYRRVANRFFKLTNRLGKLLPLVDPKKSGEALPILKDVYQLSLEVLSKK